MASPPKPWERAGATGGSTSTATLSPSPASAMFDNASSAPSSASSAVATTSPAIPARPASLASAVNQNAAAYSRPVGVGVGPSPYGSYGTYGSAYSAPYGSAYSRLGGLGGYGGGMYGGGYGGYGGMYGGGMYGGGGMGAAGMPANPTNPDSLTNRFNMSTQATFQMLEGIVGAFGGFAQMLESTYMATHSSFFAMVAVAEQFGNLRDTLGSVLGIFTLMRWIRTLLAKLTGRSPPADATALTPSAFARFEGRAASLDGARAPEPPKPSRKPLLFFLLAAFGLPYLMSKVIRSIAATTEQEEKKRQLQLQQQQLDPSQLEFCRVLWDFSPAAAGAVGATVVQGVDLEVRKGDLVAVLSKSDPLGNPSEWWKCRARDGRIGYLPATFLEVMRRPQQTVQPKPLAAIKDHPATPSISEAGSRTGSLTSTVTLPGALKAATPAKNDTKNTTNNKPASNPAPPSALPATKVGDVSAESFVKSQFYS